MGSKVRTTVLWVKFGVLSWISSSVPHHLVFSLSMPTFQIPYQYVNFIRLPAEITKERKAKSIPINHHVKKALESVPRALHHDFVFTYHGKPIGAKIRNAFKGSCERAGIPYGTKVENGIRFHDIRTTFKTNLLRAGIDKVLRDTILGHSLQGMDAYYLKPSDRDLQEAMAQFTEWIDVQLANVTQTVTQEGKSG